MFRDLFDQLCALAIILTLIAMLLLLTGFIESDPAGAGMKRDASVERAMQEKARAAFLLEVYAPINELIRSHDYPQALQKLQEMEKTYPGEPHTIILRGSILVAQGVLGEGLSRYAQAVKLNGDYVDARSGLNRRDEISRLVDKSVPELKQKLQLASNSSLEKSLKDAYYLQSRLAGGCE